MAKWRGTLISFVVGLAIWALIGWYVADLLDKTKQSLLRAASDGAFVTAVLYLGIALMAIVANAGGFYGISFLFRTIRRKFSRNEEIRCEKKTYYEYVLERKEEKHRSFAFLYLPGMFYLVAAVVLTVLFELV